MNGLYYEAFFNLATGLERLCKIVIILDYTISHNGAFPTDNDLKKIGHDIRTLICKARRIRTKYPNNDGLARFPSGSIVEQSIVVLSEFAEGARYYNLNLIQNQDRQGTDSIDDPIHAWDNRVGSEVLKVHYTEKRRGNDLSVAQKVGEILAPDTSVYCITEDGSMINDVTSMLSHQKKTEIVQKWGQFYLLTIVRYLSHLISDLENCAREKHFSAIPDLSEFLKSFRVSDKALRGRKTWSIY